MKLQGVLKQHWMQYAMIPLALLALFLAACTSSDSGNGIAPTPKVIVSVSPAANSTMAAITTTVSIVFGIDMDKSSVESTFTLSQAGGAPVAGTVVYDVATKTAVLTPAAALSHSTSYTAILDSSVLAADGSAPLTSDYSWSFTTVAAPVTIVSVSPEDASTTALVTTTVEILFGIDMNKASVEGSFTVTEVGGSAVAGSVVYASGTDTAVFTPSSDLSSDTQYSATLASTVQDATGGTPLSSDYVWSFRIAPSTVLVSTDPNGAVGATGAASTSSDIDAEGRYIVFVSTESLTTVPTGGVAQIYRKDTQTGMTRLVSTLDGSAPANVACFDPVVNSTGRYIAFTTLATNLSALSNRGATQVYLKDIKTGTLEMISKASNGSTGGGGNSAAPAMSANGLLVAFHSEASDLVAVDGNGVGDVFVYNTQSAVMERVSLDSTGGDPNNESVFPDISDDGQFVVFKSFASDLGSCTTGQGDIFVRDTVNDTNTCISQASGGGNSNGESSSPAISGDGSTVVFSSIASNLLASSSDTNGIADIFKRDSAAATATSRVSVTSTGAETTALSAYPSVSSDGRFVSFESADTNLVTGDTNGVNDVFVRDTQGTNADIVRVSVTAAGAQANDASGNARISDNGRYVSFDSNAALDAADTNGTGIADVYRGHNASYP